MSNIDDSKEYWADLFVPFLQYTPPSLNIWDRYLFKTCFIVRLIQIVIINSFFYHLIHC